MKKFEEKTFNIGDLVGISKKTIEEHLKLYSGYVKNANGVIEKLQEFGENSEANMYIIGELFRRFSFEFNGIRNHEIYFDSLSDGATPLSPESSLAQALTESAGGVENFISAFKNLALTRGIGWAMLWYDKKDKRLIASWVDEQHLGQLQDCAVILALDMWEHSFVSDYQPSGKKQYIEDFFKNLNWGKIESNFAKAK